VYDVIARAPPLPLHCPFVGKGGVSEEE